MERNIDVASKDRRNLWSASWCPGGTSSGWKEPENGGVSGNSVVGMRFGETKRVGPPPYRRDMHILK